MELAESGVSGTERPVFRYAATGYCLSTLHLDSKRFIQPRGAIG